MLLWEKKRTLAYFETVGGEGEKGEGTAERERGEAESLVDRVEIKINVSSSSSSSRVESREKISVNRIPTKKRSIWLGSISVVFLSFERRQVQFRLSFVLARDPQLPPSLLRPRKEKKKKKTMMSSHYTPLHTHLSSIHPSPLVLPVPTLQTTTSDELDHHPSHALHSSSDPTTGLLARTINNGFTLELSSIALSSAKSTSSSSVVFLPRPLRFIFPSKLVSTPTIFTSPATSYIHIVALTESGYLYRLSFPLAAAQAAGRAGSAGGAGRRSTSSWESVLEKGDWSDEYEVAGLASGRTPTVFHAADEQTVLVGLGDGTMIRLDRDQGQFQLPPFLPSFDSLSLSELTKQLL